MKVSGSTGTTETDPRRAGTSSDSTGSSEEKVLVGGPTAGTTQSHARARAPADGRGTCAGQHTAQLESTSQFCLLVLSKRPIPACLKPPGSEASGYVISKCTHVGDMSSGTKARPLVEATALETRLVCRRVGENSGWHTVSCAPVLRTGPVHVLSPRGKPGPGISERRAHQKQVTGPAEWRDG